VTLRVQRVVRDPSANLKRGARLGLGLGGIAAIAAGHPFLALCCLLGWLGVHGPRVGAYRYPIAPRKNPSNPKEASLLAMLPDRVLRRVDEHTYIVEPPPGGAPQLEIWHSVGELSRAAAWFDLELGPEPRVAGHADLVGPILDPSLMQAEAGERITMRASWLCWSTQPKDRALHELVAQAHELGRRLGRAEVRTARAQEALKTGNPLLHALIILAAPSQFELWPRARSLRPSWRWLARDQGISRPARSRAVRLLAHSGDPEEVLDLLDALGRRSSEASGLAERAAHYLEASSPDVQIAAAVVLEQVGTAAQQGALSRCQPAHRRDRAEVEKAVQRALVAIAARHGQVDGGALALVEDGVAEGALALSPPIEEE